MLQDRTMECQDCSQEFAFTVGEQEFYAQKGLSDPKYCMICRGIHEAQERQMGRYRKK